MERSITLRVDVPPQLLNQAGEGFTDPIHKFAYTVQHTLAEAGMSIRGVSCQRGMLTDERRRDGIVAEVDRRLGKYFTPGPRMEAKDGAHMDITDRADLADELVEVVLRWLSQ